MVHNPVSVTVMDGERLRAINTIADALRDLARAVVVPMNVAICNNIINTHGGAAGIRVDVDSGQQRE